MKIFCEGAERDDCEPVSLEEFLAQNVLIECPLA